jgi:hypothetical protein
VRLPGTCATGDATNATPELRLHARLGRSGLQLALGTKRTHLSDIVVGRVLDCGDRGFTGRTSSDVHTCVEKRLPRGLSEGRRCC